jgi:hypothetical protein
MDKIVRITEYENKFKKLWNEKIVRITEYENKF